MSHAVSTNPKQCKVFLLGTSALVCLALSAPVVAREIVITSGTTTNNSGGSLNGNDTANVTGTLDTGTTDSEHGILASDDDNKITVSEVSADPPNAPIATPVEVTDWSGFYAGLQFDAVSGNTERDSSPSFKADLEGSIVSGFVGYRWAVGRYIVGAELDIALNGDGKMVYTEGGLSPGETFDINSALRFGGEFGMELGGSLAYVGLGFTKLDVKVNQEFDDQGYYVGIGYDYFVSDSIMVGLEINYHDFNDLDGASDRVTPITLGINVAHKF